MKTLMIGLSLCIALAAASGCGSNTGSGGGGDPAGSPLSCNNPEEHLCSSYASIDEDQRAITCDGETEVPSCALSAVRASCSWTDYTGNNVTYWYSDSPRTDVEIEHYCTDLTGTLTMN